MTTRPTQTLPFVVTHPRVVGLVLLLIPIPFGAVASLSSSLIVPNDAAATANNITNSEFVYRLGIVRSLLLMVVDACVAVLVFYPLFRPVQADLALLMLVLNLLGVPITMLSEVSQFATLFLLRSAEALAAFTPDQIHVSVSVL